MYVEIADTSVVLKFRFPTKAPIVLQNLPVDLNFNISYVVSKICR